MMMGHRLLSSMPTAQRAITVAAMSLVRMEQIALYAKVPESDWRAPQYLNCFSQCQQIIVLKMPFLILQILPTLLTLTNG